MWELNEESGIQDTQIGSSTGLIPAVFINPDHLSTPSLTSFPALPTQPCILQRYEYESNDKTNLQVVLVNKHPLHSLEATFQSMSIPLNYHVTPTPSAFTVTIPPRHQTILILVTAGAMAEPSHFHYLLTYEEHRDWQPPSSSSIPPRLDLHGLEMLDTG